MHDLVRLYARQLAMNDPRRAPAIRKIIDHYFRLCGRLHNRLSTATHYSAEDGEMNEVLREIDLELPNVVAAVTQAHETGIDDVVIQLAEAMFMYFDLRKCWDAWIHVDQLALLSASRAGDAHAASRIRLNLGVAFRDLGRFDDAIGCGVQSLAYFREAGDSPREAEALNNLAVVLRKCGRIEEAYVELGAALAVWQRLEDAHGQTRALNNMGLVHMSAGSYAAAVDCFGRALDLVCTTDDERRRAKVLHNYGVVCRRLGRFAESADRLTLALELRRKHGDRYREAKTLAELGTVMLEVGRARRASTGTRGVPRSRRSALGGHGGRAATAGEVISSRSATRGPHPARPIRSFRRAPGTD
jgi:tetratricopeptide (TPR) repeat protein